jgi:hypothetical protein
VQAECSENSRGIHYATIIFNGLLRWRNSMGITAKYNQDTLDGA